MPQDRRTGNRVGAQINREEIIKKKKVFPWVI
jgi:hypothetical protein